MQALESLNDSQVNDFLSGKTPLNLSMRLGDHMMLIQLQLSTVNPSNSTSTASTSMAGSSGSNHSSRTRLFRSKTTSSTRSTPTTATTTLMQQHSSSTNSTPIKFSNVNHMYKSLSSDQIIEKYRHRNVEQLLKRATDSNEFDELHNIVNSLGKNTENSKKTENDVEMDTNSDNDALLEQSPIKSLSNLVSGPIKTSSLKSIPMSASTSSNSKITSCPCKSIENRNCDTNCQNAAHKKLTNQSDLKTVARSSALLRKTLNNPITKAKSNGQYPILHHSSSGCSSSSKTAATNIINSTNLRRTKSTDNIAHHEQGIAKMVSVKSLNNEIAIDQPINIIDTTAGSSINTTTDTLAEASRNLTKTLRKLSKEVFSGKSDATNFIASEEKRRSTNANAQSHSSNGSHQSSNVAGFGSGAVIESMRNHGRGIYSGKSSALSIIIH